MIIKEVLEGYHITPNRKYIDLASVSSYRWGQDPNSRIIIKEVIRDIVLHRTGSGNTLPLWPIMVSMLTFPQLYGDCQRTFKGMSIYTKVVAFIL